ncbi:uncharacterized protein LOC141683942 [Apium graveolens]|uniref:uncharacterized protein LOC141683942 n=1 Tax=Apium graveolens TaxID=4045 RepID=UPI003D78E4EB
MSGKTHTYEAWQERTISEASVEYHLLSLSRNSLLAVVGNKDRNGRMRYVVAKDFLEAFGSNSTINAYTKWTKQSEVRKWITSFVRGDELPLTNLDHQDDGSSKDEEKEVVRHAPVDLTKLNDAVTRCVVIALPAVPQGEPRSRRRGKGKCLNLVPKHQGEGSTKGEALEPKSHQPASFRVGEKIEILCQDSRMRGCWFVCKIVNVLKNKFKVQYNDVDNVEGSGKLEEWVCASKLADPDKLSLRHSGRPIIRPCPTEEPSRQFFEVGTAVEAWWNNGWWESFVLTGVSLSSNNDTYHVFLPGVCKFLDLHCKDLRVAKDWIGDTWVAVNPQPDILSVIQLCLEQREE